LHCNTFLLDDRCVSIGIWSDLKWTDRIINKKK